MVNEIVKWTEESVLTITFIGLEMDHLLQVIKGSHDRFTCNILFPLVYIGSDNLCLRQYPS